MEKLLLVIDAFGIGCGRLCCWQALEREGMQCGGLRQRLLLNVLQDQA